MRWPLSWRGKNTTSLWPKLPMVNSSDGSPKGVFTLRVSFILMPSMLYNPLPPMTPIFAISSSGYKFMFRIFFFDLGPLIMLMLLFFVLKYSASISINLLLALPSSAGSCIYILYSFSLSFTTSSFEERGCTRTKIFISFYLIASKGLRNALARPLQSFLKTTMS